MASRAHDLVLRDLRPARPCAGLSAVRRALRLPVQQLLRRRRASATRGPSAGCSAARRSTRSATGAHSVDEALDRALPACRPTALELVELGINHEQQHQELFLTDILATFAENPLEPAYAELAAPACFATEPLTFHPGRNGIVEIGARERRLRVRLRAAAPPRLPAPARHRQPQGHQRRMGASSSPTAAIATPTLWLSEGWDWVQRERIAAPLYWHERRHAVHARRPPRDRPRGAGRARQLSTRPTPSPAGPARGCRPRPNGRDFAESADPYLGNQLDQAGAVAAASPAAACSATSGNGPRAPISPYPGFAPAEGAVGEYNGKFMSGQFVLKGASCATPRGHSRASYRNFFPPAARWQFTGLRLARDS